MSKRNKLQKFAEMLTFPNVYENFHAKKPSLTHLGEEEVNRKGQWNKLHFRTEKPITLELACGRGEYTLELARRYPNRHFIGVDIKGARLWKGARTALDEDLHHVAFLRTRIEYLHHFFAPAEIDEIWITFPDPFPRKSKANRRLSSDFFLDIYRKILRPKGLIHLKTDDPGLYEFSLETWQNASDIHMLYADSDIYKKDLPFPELNIQTYYEKMHLAEGRKIKYLRAQWIPQTSKQKT